MKYIFRIILLLLLIFQVSCKPKPQEKTHKTKPSDFNKILKRGKLIAITGYNPYSYFIYKGQLLGYEYELLKRLCKDFNLDLKIKVVKNMNKMFEMLENGEGDLIAFNLTVTKKRKDKYAFSLPLSTTKQVLVQKMPDNWRKLTRDQIEKKLIRNPLKLEGKTVVVRNASSYIQRLKNLSDEIGGGINIKIADPNLTVDDLIKMVANGEIDFTVADKNVAHLNEAFYPNIDANTELSFSQKIAWAFRKNSTKLVSAVDKWLVEIKKKPDFYVIYNKYFKNRTAYRKRLNSDYLSYDGGKISKYDKSIKAFADTLRWDWRLLASLIFQESQFDPNAKSWVGAVGLMQVMPNTAKDYNIFKLEIPKQNMEAGVQHLLWLKKYWKKEIQDSSEMQKFVLASYNIGLGHIEDARKLAKKYGGNPNVWTDNVEKYLLLKSQRKYFTDPVVRNGYARGIETVKYVKEILERYHHYLQLIS